MQHDLESGNLKNVYVRNDASEGGEDVPLSELQSEQQQHDSSQPELDALSPANATTSESACERSASFNSEHAASSSPASGASSEGRDVNEQIAVSGAVAHEGEQMPARGDASTAGDKDGKGTAASSADCIAPEQRREDHLHELEAQKLAKQQELFGKSFSTPQRCGMPSRRLSLT